MTQHQNTTEADRLKSARESFSGRLLTDAQFDESIAITGIVEREIQKSGAFKDKLGDYAYAFARSEKFDVMKAETVLRDLFKERTGQSMNDMRKELVGREDNLPDQARQSAYNHATGLGDLIENGDKISFNRAFAQQAQTLATELQITDIGAKRLMSDEFKAAEGSELYDWGKELEEQFYRPQIEAEKQQRQAQQTRGTGSSRSGAMRRGRTGPQ